MKNKKLLALDMDDVVCDWMREADSFLENKDDEKIVDGYRVSQMTWDRLTEHHRFYRNLELLPGAQELIDWARSYSKRNDMFLCFLTALPHDDSVPFAAYDKALWGYERYPDIPVFFGPYSFDKHNHCRVPGSILIDDRHDNCLDWTNAGGIAHIYRDWTGCQRWIRNTLGDEI